MTATVLFDNLPGYPDNLSVSAEGVIWTALFAPRHAQAEALMQNPAWTRVISSAFAGAAPVAKVRISRSSSFTDSLVLSICTAAPAPQRRCPGG